MISMSEINGRAKLPVLALVVAIGTGVLAAAAIGTPLADLVTQVGINQNKLQDLETDIQDLETDIQDLETDIRDLENEIKEVRADVKDIRNAVNDNGKQIALIIGALNLNAEPDIPVTGAGANLTS